MFNKKNKKNRKNKENWRREIMNREIFIILALCLLLCLCSPIYAIQKPRSLATDKRIKVVAFEENNVIPIHGTTFITTQVIFGHSEQIVNINGGDSAAWTISVDKSLPNILNIKPTILGSNSNLDVVTIDSTSKQRYYRFQLISNEQPVTNTDIETYAIQFIYPEREKARLLAQLHFKRQQDRALVNNSKSPQDYNWDYSFNGSREIMPLHVFDDGKFTYMELQSNQAVPAIFAVDNRAGRESVVNFRSKGNYIVVQRTAPQFTLRNGKTIVASIFNNRMIAKMN